VCPHSRSQAPRPASLVNLNRLQYRQCAMISTPLVSCGFVLCKHGMDWRRRPKRVLYPCAANWFRGFPAVEMGGLGGWPATMAVAAETVIVLLQPAQRTQLSVTPSDSTPPSTTVSTAISPAMPQRPPVQAPTTVASEPPQAPMPPPPTTRAPISVSPESRPPFPEQSPPRNNDQRGGLLGGLL